MTSLEVVQLQRVNVGKSSCEASHFCVILSKIRKCQLILVKIPNTKLYVNHLV